MMNDAWENKRSGWREQANPLSCLGAPDTAVRGNNLSRKQIL